MKFNRLALIEKIKANKDRAQAEYTELSALWDAALEQAKEGFRETQRKNLKELVNRLLVLRDNPNVWTKTEVAPALNPTSKRYDWDEVDYLHYSEDNSGPHTVQHNGVDVELRRRPNVPDTSKHDALVRVLESAEDEFVTTSGLESMGFRNISYVWA